MTRAALSFAFLSAALLALGPQAAIAAPPAVTEDMSLVVGESRTLPADDVKSYNEPTPGIAEVRVTPNGKQFVIIGKKQGSTTLLLIKKDDSEVTYRITVYPRDVKIVEDEVNQLLNNQAGVRMRRVGSRLFIEGGVSSQPELERIQHIWASMRGKSSRWSSSVARLRIAKPTCASTCTSCSTKRRS